MPDIRNCPEHGLRYNAELSEGCVLCKPLPKGGRSGAKLTPAQWVAVFGGLFFLVALAGARWMIQSYKETPPIDLESFQGGRLSAETYREQVEAIEAIVYGEDEPWKGDAERLERALGELRIRLKRDKEMPELRMVEEVTRKVQRTAKKVEGKGALLPGARKQWITSWEGAATRMFRKDEGLRAFDGYRGEASARGEDFTDVMLDLMADIDQEVGNLQMYTDDLPERVVSARDFDRDEHERRVREYRFRMAEVVDDAARLAERIPSTDRVPLTENMRAAHSSVRQAVRVLGEPPEYDPDRDRGRAPERGDYIRWVAEIERWMSAARRSMSRGR